MDVQSKCIPFENFFLNLHDSATDKLLGETMMMTIKQYLAALGLLASAVLLGGCNASFINLTPVYQNQNPSGIYTLQTEVDLQDKSVAPKSVKVSVVIGGEAHPMVNGQIGDNVWSYDYKMPKGFDEANYFYRAEYNVLRENFLKPRVIKSQLYRFQLENRYVANLLAYRAPIGTKIAVQGRGFTKYDKVEFGGVEAETKMVSVNELQFIVPALPSGVDYSLTLTGGAGKLPIGDFRIDETSITVTPSKLDLRTGQVVTLTFAIDFDAPAGGLPVAIQTDVAKSVIMQSEVRIQQGSDSVSAKMQAGVPGRGSIFVKVPGIKEVAVPVTIAP